MYLSARIFVVLMTWMFGADAARILGIVHMPAYSHFQLGDRIFRELAANGHEVTVITPYESKSPVKNLKPIVLTGFLEEMEVIKTDMFTSSDMNVPTKIVWFDIMGLYFTEYVLKHPNVQKLLNSNEQFDLIIYENFLNDAFSGFSHHFKAPYVILSTVGPSRIINGKMGNPTHPAYVPDFNLSYPSKMTFWQRLINTVVYAASELFSHTYTQYKQNQLLQKYFKSPPHLDDLVYNASLTLLNSHISIAAPVPLVPNMIEIGGYHVKPPKPLPEDLKTYLDSAKEGVVFFSMGSNIKSRDMPLEKRSAILKSLGKLKQKVLWKWEDDVLPGQPQNVKLAKWLPQQDILAHPNIKLFITHGGLLSTIEAIYHGVPVLGLPVFGDQELNIRHAENAGYGIGVPFKRLTETDFASALHEMLHNQKYSENAKLRSKILHDQQTKPLDRAIYWLEYVMRHRGAPHLKTAALNLKWYQYLLLDVTAVILLSIATITWIFYKCVRILCRRKDKSTVTKDKKQK